MIGLAGLSSIGTLCILAGLAAALWTVLMVREPAATV